MNKKMIIKTIGRILLVEAFLLCFPLIISLIYRESLKNVFAFLITIIILLVIGGLFSSIKVKKRNFYAKEGLVIVALIWILLSFFGGLPLYFSREYKSLVDTFFEISSGFTTTGASVATNVEGLSHSILFWRSFTHLIGGMGVLVFALAIMPQINEDSIYLMKAEVPGPVFGKLVSKMGDTARILYAIYLVMTVVLTFLLWIAGMPFFDSMLHAFGTAGTGGFGIKNTSIAFYNNPLVEHIIAWGMLIFGVNFNLYYFILIGKIKDFFKNEELKWYIGIMFFAVFLIMANVYFMYPNISENFRNVFFTVSSVMTTTGYSTADFNNWPLFSHIILLILMFIGGCAGSTAGGIKVARVATSLKSSLSEIKRVRNPKQVVTARFDGKVLDNQILKSLSNYYFIYIFLFIFLMLIVSFDTPDFISAFSSVAATFNNIGPGLGMVGPSSSYAELSNISKVALSFGMIAGRLEILPIMILFSIGTWKKA